MNQPKTLSCADGQPLVINEFLSDSARGTIIIAGAIGVSQSFYHKFASYLSEQGYNALTFDYRGTGENRVKAASALKLSDWGAQDIEAVIQQAKTLNLPVYLIGHSMGGQLLGLAPSAAELEKIVMVASSAPHWTRWSFPHSFKMLLVSRVIFPLVSRLTKDFPTKTFGLGNITIPSGLFSQWARWMTKSDYLIDPKFQLNTEQYQALNQPTLALGFSDDDLAPEANIHHLMTLMPQLQSEVRIIEPQQTSSTAIGHTGFFRDKFKTDLWQPALQWLENSQQN